MLVADSASLRTAIDELSREMFLACDTETTGLRVHAGDELFSISIASETKEYYFNFGLYDDANSLPDEAFAMLQRELFDDKFRTWIFHNAKFDLAFLRQKGIVPAGRVDDVWVLEVLHDNQHFDYSLDTMAKRWGYEKLDTVHAYCVKEKLYEEVEDLELNKRVKLFHYEQVPLSLMVPYAERDARITYDIYTKIHAVLHMRDQTTPTNWPKIHTVHRNESDLTKAMHSMEWEGVRLDTKFCREAVSYYQNSLSEMERKFEQESGEKFSLGPLLFKRIFESEKDTWTFTEKGNPQFDDAALARFKSPLAKYIREWRTGKKQVEYFQNFLWLKDPNDFIHTDYKQNVKTGRTSSRGPNLQNLTRPDEDSDGVLELYPVRKAFIPRDNHFFAMIDYKQIEYRLMLDFAGAWPLIDEIMNNGLDVHQATANLAGITRYQAKTTNFLTLYGGGIKKLAGDLGVSEQEARRIQNAIFTAAPEIKQFIRNIINTGESRGYIFNFLGRHYQAPKDRTYALPNHFIQGTAADVIKIAINRIHKYLETKKSKYLLLVHDENIFDVHYGEEGIVNELKAIMESVHKYRRLPLLASVDFSEKNLAEKSAFDEAKVHGAKTGNGL